jgi:hypothetical protein
MSEVSVRIRGVDFALKPELGSYSSRVASDKRGGYVLAEVTPVHTHECVRRRWGRRNHHKECNCGAEQLFSLIEWRGRL